MHVKRSNWDIPPKHTHKTQTHAQRVFRYITAYTSRSVIKTSACRLSARGSICLTLAVASLLAFGDLVPRALQQTLRLLPYAEVPLFIGGRCGKVITRGFGILGRIKVCRLDRCTLSRAGRLGIVLRHARTLANSVSRIASCGDNVIRCRVSRAIDEGTVETLHVDTVNARSPVVADFHRRGGHTVRVGLLRIEDPWITGIGAAFVEGDGVHGGIEPAKVAILGGDQRQAHDDG